MESLSNHAYGISKESQTSRRIMSRLEKLQAEELELEAQYTQKLGDQSTDSATDSEQSEDQASDGPTEEVTTHEIPDDDDDETAAPQTRTNWKKRFTGYKSSTDATLYEQRQELAALRAQNVQLMTKMQELASKREEQGEDMFQGAFTPEDVDTFGADGLDVVKKAAKHAIDSQVKPLKEQLAQVERERLERIKRDSENESKISYNKFLDSLKGLVPDYAKLNADSKFLSWIKQPDEYSGLPRVSLLRKAEANRDSYRVADFFKSFKKANAPSIEKHITPIGSGGSQPVSKGKDQPVFKKSEIDKFYNDIMKGLYKGKHDEMMAIERSIEQAVAQGRISNG